MKNKNLTNKNSTVKVAIVCAAIGWICWSAANFCQAQTQPANPSGLSPDLQEVVKLSQEQMSDDVITNYIKNSGKTYTLTADDLIYLKDQKVSQGVISALEQTANDGTGQNSSPTNSPSLSPNLNSGLIACYPFNGDANDASGNGRNGTLYNSPTFVAGPVPGTEAIHLVGQGEFGTSGQYVTIPSIELSGYNAFTISLWANIQGESSTDAGEMVIGLGQGHSDGSATVCVNCFSSGNQIGFNAGTAAVGTTTASYLNQWHRYSLVYSDGVLTAYLDGQVLGSQNGSMVSTAGNAGMGIHWWSFAPGVSTRFIGSLADVRIYNRALSSQEIQTLSFAQSPPTSSTPPTTGNVYSAPTPVQTATPPAPSAAPQNNLVQEYDDYVFEIKECKLEDREDKQLNDGKPHKQLICKVLVTNKVGDRKLNMHGNVNGARIRAIDDMGTEYDISGGTLGTSLLNCYAFEWPDGANAALVMPSGVPVKVMLVFGATRDGIGYFSPNAQSLGVLDIGFISEDESGNKPFHIQFKNVPIPLVEAPPTPVAVAPAPPAPTPMPDNGPTPTSDTTQSPATQAVNFDYFHDQLAPFGTWVQVEGYGWCWHPDAAINANPNWRPYYDMGQWVYTDNGWFWQSDYTWGDIPFHYGNWILDPTYGWLWVPGYTWGPSWVFWRQAETDGCIGWAPLPPGAVFVDGGWLFHGRHYGVDFDFGLGEGYFAFIGYDHFHDDFFRMRGREFPFHISREWIHTFYGRTVLRNDFRRDEHGRLINDGIGRDRIERLTNHREVAAHFEERNPVGDRNKLNGEVQRQNVQHPGPNNAPLIHPAAEQVSKVFRPPVQMPRPTASPSQQKQSQSQQPKQSPKKQ